MDLAHSILSCAATGAVPYPLRASLAAYKSGMAQYALAAVLAAEHRDLDYILEEKKNA